MTRTSLLLHTNVAPTKGLIHILHVVEILTAREYISLDGNGFHFITIAKIIAFSQQLKFMAERCYPKELHFLLAKLFALLRSIDGFSS